jgi:hypothetical protein
MPGALDDEAICGMDAKLFEKRALPPPPIRIIKAEPDMRIGFWARIFGG